MRTVTIDYAELNTISRAASRAADSMQDYINALSKRVTARYADLEGGATSKTQNSAYYVKQKMAALKSKKSAYHAFSARVSKFSAYAQNTDKTVARTIASAKETFIDRHDYVRVDWTTKLQGFLIHIENSCPLLEAIGGLVDDALSNLSSAYDELKYWYKCGGGKEIVGCVLAVAGAIASVVIAVCACVPPLGGIVAICAAVGAVIAAINAVVNVYTSVKALQAQNDGDPAWAKIYSERDTAQDVLRQTRFESGCANRWSYAGAFFMDVVDTVCAVVALADGLTKIKGAYKELKRYSQRSRTRNFAQVFKSYVFNEKNYKGLKLREYIQQRVEGEKALKQTQKQIRKISGNAKKWQKAFQYGGKFLEYVANPPRFQDVAKDLWDETQARFYTASSINDIHSLYQNNLNALYKDIKGMAGWRACSWRRSLPEV